jgi:hypothetical protein
MMIQHFLKGICGIDDSDAAAALHELGIFSRWWTVKGTVTPAQMLKQLTEANLFSHLNNYDTFGPRTPFISTTAGAVIRDSRGARNLIQTAEWVATYFATNGFREQGWVFAGYVLTLGRKAVTQQPFAEEVRELHLYTGYLPYQPEGELVGKIHIPAVQLEAAWPVTPRFDNFGNVRWPTRGPVERNTDVYVQPHDIVNVRGVL